MGLSARKDRRHSGAHWALTSDTLAAAANERPIADLHAGNVGNRIPRARLAIEGNGQIARARSDVSAHQPSSSLIDCARTLAIRSISSSVETIGGPRQMMSRAAPVPPG